MIEIEGKITDQPIVILISLRASYIYITLDLVKILYFKRSISKEVIMRNHGWFN